MPSTDIFFLFSLNFGLCNFFFFLFNLHPPVLLSFFLSFLPSCQTPSTLTLPLSAALSLCMVPSGRAPSWFLHASFLH